MFVNLNLSNVFFCTWFLYFLFKISLSIALNNVLDSKLFILTPKLAASGKPPRLVIITAQPLLLASNAVLPKGSSQREQVTEILEIFNLFKISLCFLNPKTFKFLCFKLIFSLGSSPNT